MADGNKTEEATPKRRTKAREQGQVARSRELPGVFALAAVAGVVALMAPSSDVYKRQLITKAATCLCGSMAS